MWDFRSPAAPQKSLSELEGNAADLHTSQSSPLIEFREESSFYFHSHTKQHCLVAFTSEHEPQPTQPLTTMAKTAKLKKKRMQTTHFKSMPSTPANRHTEVAPHSRAARRAASPSLPIALPKKDAARSPSPSRPSETKHHVLSAKSSGISKKRNTKLTRAQRVRAEKAMERAADDMDKFELKKQKSIEKAGAIKGRAKVWEEVNDESVKGKKGGAKSAFAVLAEGDGEGRKGVKWVGDEVMDEVKDENKDGAVEEEQKEGGVEVVSSAIPQDDELL